MISLLGLTWDRLEVTKHVFTHNLENAGVPREEMELLVCDNGSTDPKVHEFVETLNPVYHRINSKNEGIGHSLNQLYLRSKGDIIVTFSNDIELPNGWAMIAKEYLAAVPNCGIAGFDWGHDSLPAITTQFGVKAHWLNPTLNRVFGTWILKRKVIEEIGFFCEDYGPYGIEDTDFNERVNLAGFHSFYMPGVISNHLVNDVGQDTEYRKMKDVSLHANCAVFNARAPKWHTDGIREPLPPNRDPL